ncbi:MAG: SAM-dependent methyltransferase, partial [Phycisphaerales bacterium]
MAQPRKLHDQYFKLAKAEGYLARSAYKLKEINEKKRLIRRGDRVIDLGCAPGSWLQVVEAIIGQGGLAVGIDLQEVRPIFGPRVTTMVAD